VRSHLKYHDNEKGGYDTTILKPAFRENLGFFIPAVYLGLYCLYGIFPQPPCHFTGWTVMLRLPFHEHDDNPVEIRVLFKGGWECPKGALSFFFNHYRFCVLILLYWCGEFFLFFSSVFFFPPSGVYGYACTFCTKSLEEWMDSLSTVTFDTNSFMPRYSAEGR